MSLPTPPPSGAAFTAAMAAAVTQGQRRAAGQRSQAGTLCLLATGYDVVGSPPLGFTRNGIGQRVVDPDEWPTVQWLFAQALAAPSLAQLQRDLDGEPGLVQLSASTIGRVLRNRIYVDGAWTARCANHVLTMPAVELQDPISPLRFAQVEQVLRARRPHPKPRSLTNLPPHPSLLLTIPPPRGWPRRRGVAAD